MTIAQATMGRFVLPKNDEFMPGEAGSAVQQGSLHHDLEERLPNNFCDCFGAEIAPEASKADVDAAANDAPASQTPVESKTLLMTLALLHIDAKSSPVAPCARDASDFAHKHVLNICDEPSRNLNNNVESSRARLDDEREASSLAQNEAWSVSRSLSNMDCKAACGFESEISLSALEHRTQLAESALGVGANKTLDAFVKLNVLQLETHFPAMLAHSAPFISHPLAAETASDAGAHMTDIHVDEAKAPASVVKFLQFQLEPESMGVIDVRMKLMRSHVELRIGVSNTNALDLLNTSQDELARAMTAAGRTLDLVSIEVSPTPADASTHQGDASEYGADRRAGGSSQDLMSGEHGGASDGKGEADSRGAKRRDYRLESKRLLAPARVHGLYV